MQDSETLKKEIDDVIRRRYFLMDKWRDVILHNSFSSFHKISIKKFTLKLYHYHKKRNSLEQLDPSFKNENFYELLSLIACIYNDFIDEWLEYCNLSNSDNLFGVGCVKQYFTIQFEKIKEEQRLKEEEEQRKKSMEELEMDLKKTDDFILAEANQLKRKIKESKMELLEFNQKKLVNLNFYFPLIAVVCSIIHIILLFQFFNAFFILLPPYTLGMLLGVQQYNKFKTKISNKIKELTVNISEL
jgi:hypothetical protein